ncbi:nucleotide-diphospho-sugar transferase [Gloeopeniophorella convolvens]|nr:nucleotide-diphospho-sugar transferase [Gloeopeniophorella convolvens]
MNADNKGFLFTPTQDWFTFNVETWRSFFPLVESKAPRVLEIGSWEGRSAVFLLTELCKADGEIVCVDHFDLLRTQAGRERYSKITHNLTLTGGRFRIKDQFSFPALMEVLAEEISAVEPGFDWVYVDGSHEADDTFLDGELAWRLGRKGAIFIFDDYDWETQPKDSRHHPKRGIDAFLALHEGEYRKLSDADQYQMIIQKTSDMRIGFLVRGEVVGGEIDHAFGYGANVAYAVDKSYVMPLLVSIRSLLAVSAGRITVYILDCGLSEKDKSSIVNAIPTREDFTLTFLDPPGGNLAQAKGATWAKVDLISSVPAERVLYLDADTLILENIQGLWHTDLRGKALGAAVDVGYPSGHGEVGEGRYFNAGVLLMDLTSIRRRLPELKELSKGAEHAHFADQDALNLHFRGDWEEIPLRWNAQGLGTYVENSSPDRERIKHQLEDMKGRPAIVHFTGPTNPDVELVLNPWVQPYTAKPWGYAGAPGHPFAAAWWEVLQELPGWGDFRSSRAFEEFKKEEIEKALGRARAKFEDAVSM